MGDEEKLQKTWRERFAIRLMGLATWMLPEDHPGIIELYHVAETVDRVAKRRKDQIA